MVAKRSSGLPVLPEVRWRREGITMKSDKPLPPEEGATEAAAESADGDAAAAIPLPLEEGAAGIPLPVEGEAGGRAEGPDDDAAAAVPLPVEGAP
jgi:hypothetical protein